MLVLGDEVSQYGTGSSLLDAPRLKAPLKFDFCCPQGNVLTRASCCEMGSIELLDEKYGCRTGMLQIGPVA